MGSKTRLGSYCTKRANNGVNLVTSRNINTRLARPIGKVIRMKVIWTGNGLDFQLWTRLFLSISNRQTDRQKCLFDQNE